MTETRSLAGEWDFALDPEDVGETEAWYGSDLDDTVWLPGTTDENRTGERNDAREQDHLTRQWPYEGVAWYQRTVTVPESWADAHVELALERSRVTRVWVDDEPVGEGESLCAPQRFDLSDALTPGECRLTVRVDNDADLLHDRGVRRSHMVTEETQTNWNGVVGDVELRVSDPVHVADVQVYPDLDGGTARVAATVRNDRDAEAAATLSLAGASRGGTYETVEPTTVDATVAPGETTVEAAVGLGETATWDEFGQSRYELRAELETDAGDADAETTAFGVRDFATEGRQFEVNGRTTFLRGNLDCCVFPETGYAPMDAESWRDHLGTMRAYGLNHVRFHSWCPPEAAFEAADELGMYLQPELPVWDNSAAFEDEEMRAYFRREAERILDAYGDHPSFAMFALGNELEGSREAMVELVDHCREYDPRHRYAHGAYNFLSDPHPGENEDFWVTASIASDVLDREGGKVPVRGSYADETADGTPTTADDYGDLISAVDVPIVTHEIGQFQVYPDFDETAKYGEVLRPRNFEVAADHLEAHSMRDMDAAFQRASGELAVACYREEVEAALRTPELGGFQLLELQDFPGQGTALVGLLDSFMDSKGIVDPERWRDYCAPTVALARIETHTWTTEQTFEASLELAHYGAEDLAGVTAEWRLDGPEGTVAEGTLDAGDVAQGTLAELGEASVDLGDVNAPAALELAVSVPTADATNRYDVWVYPEGPGLEAPEGLTVRSVYDEEAADLLDEGEDVLLLTDPEDRAHTVEGAFQPSFWSYALFKRTAPPGTLGLLHDEDHPLFDAFPSPGRTDWQWYSVVENARPVVLDDAPDDFDPVVRVVDNIERNQKLGLVFETGVRGGGNLLVCAAPLRELDDPAADQLLRALFDYADSAAFDPDPALSGAVRRKLLGP